MPCGAVSRSESETRSVLQRGTGKLPRVRQAVMKDKSLFPQKRGKRAQDFITLSQSRANAIKRGQTRNKKRLMPPLGGCKGGGVSAPLQKRHTFVIPQTAENAGTAIKNPVCRLTNREIDSSSQLS